MTFFGYTVFAHRESDSEPGSTAEILPPSKANGAIISEAVVVPMQSASLSMAAAGVVGEVLIQENDIVTEGQLLIRLEDSQQRASIAQAEAKLLGARARLEELMGGNRPQEIVAAEAALNAAKANLLQLSEGVSAEDMRIAEATLAESQQVLQELDKGPNDAEIIDAQVRLKNAEAELQRAQSAYNQVKWRNDVGALPESAALQKATNDYEAAKANYDVVLNGASQTERAQAVANVQKAQANLDKLLAPPSENSIAAARAEVARLQAELELIQAGSRVEKIQSAASEVFAAEAALEEAKSSLAKTELRAPFAGTIASLDLAVGEYVSPGRTVLQLADFTEWYLETEDLTEVSVVNVKRDTPVTVTMDAIPDLQLTGHVVRIKPLGENKQGDVIYTALVQLDEQDGRLRWNMTAEVRIGADPSEQN